MKSNEEGNSDNDEKGLKEEICVRLFIKQLILYHISYIFVPNDGLDNKNEYIDDDDVLRYC